MNPVTTFLVRTASLAGLSVLSLSAAAALLTSTANFDLVQKDIVAGFTNTSGVVDLTNTGPRDSSQVLSFSRFNSSLGTLQGVTIQVTSSHGAITSMSALLQNPVDATPLLTFFADGSSAGKITGLAGLFDKSFNASPSSSCSLTNLAPKCTGDPDDSSASFNANQAYTSVLAAFIGSGSFDLTASLSSALAPRTLPDNGTGFIDNASMEGLMSNIQWAGSVTVTYDYLVDTVNQAPEAVSLYLVLAGLAAAAWRRRQG